MGVTTLMNLVTVFKGFLGGFKLKLVDSYANFCAPNVRLVLGLAVMSHSSHLGHSSQKHLQELYREVSLLFRGP